METAWTHHLLLEFVISGAAIAYGLFIGFVIASLRERWETRMQARRIREFRPSR